MLFRSGRDANAQEPCWRIVRRRERVRHAGGDESPGLAPDAALVVAEPEREIALEDEEGLVLISSAAGWENAVARVGADLFGMELLDVYEHGGHLR